jgi:2-methylcitrate dehydratase PrpD
MPQSPGPTRRLAEFIASLRFDDLPDAVVRQACDIVLDTVGCALGAWRDDPDKAEIAARIAATFQAAPVAAIASITNETYATVKSHFSAKQVTTPMGARVSVPYCCAVAALDRAAGQAQFTADRVLRDDVQGLLARTEVIADPELTRLYPAKFPARVTVTLKDGRRLVAMRNFPKGDPQDPLTPAEIEQKFLDNASARRSGAEAREIVRLVRDLPALTDPRPLLQLLAS